MDSRIVRLLSVGIAAVGLAVAFTSVTTASAHIATFPVVRCSTTFAAGTPPRTPSTLTVRSNTTTSGLAAYTNTWEYLIAPAGMRCAGFVAGDGGSSIKV